MNSTNAPRRLSVRFAALCAVVLALGAVVVPAGLGGAAPTEVEIPITSGGMGVNGTPVLFPTVPGAKLVGTYDPDTGAFSGRLVIPAFSQSGVTSIDDDFTLEFAAVDAEVSGTIPQTGNGTLGPVGWTVGVALPDYFITTGCTVTIAPLTLTTTFDASGATPALALTATGFSIPGSECANPVDEADVDAVLAIPTSATSMGLLAADASALLPPAPQPSFTG